MTETIGLIGTPDTLTAMILPLIARLQQQEQVAVIDSGQMLTTDNRDNYLPKSLHLVMEQVLVARPYTQEQFDEAIEKSTESDVRILFITSMDFDVSHVPSGKMVYVGCDEKHADSSILENVYRV